MQRSGNDWEALEALAEIYYERAREVLAQLETAIRAHRGTEIRDLAHSLKGSLGALGGITAYQSALTLEKADADMTHDEVASLFDTLRRDVEIFNDALKTLIEEKTL